MLALALVGATLLVGPATSAAAAPCTAAQLRVALGRGDNAAGTLYLPLVFTNQSGRPCTLRGYPGVSSVRGANGSQIGVPADRSGQQTVRRVRLAARGGKATATYAHVRVGVFDPADCRPVTARGLRVFPPNQTHPFYIRWQHGACSTRLGNSHVSPVVPG